MNLNKEQRDFVQNTIKKAGGKISASALSFMIRRRFNILLNINDVKDLIVEFSSPPPAVASKVIPDLSVLSRQTKNAKSLCRDLINDLKAEAVQLYLEPEELELSSSGVSPILCLSDLHFGEIIEMNGEHLFNLDIAKARFNNIIDQAILAPELEAYEVDEFIVLLAGDIIDGELIFPAQSFETEFNVFDQLKVATIIIWEGLQKLSKYFPNVKVYCVPGNHGRTSKLHHQMSNWDNALYFALQLMSLTTDPASASNIQVFTPHQMWMDFTVRCWNVHTRHIGVSQASTPSPAKKVKTWMDNHNADLFFYGHYHCPELYSHGYKRIFKNGSLPPANEFAERLGFEDSCGQWLVGITDSNPIAFMKILVPE